jgi:group I intron endonuclease
MLDHLPSLTLQGAISMDIYSQDKVATIYRATNTINGKVYIGFTTHRPSRRINNHKHRSSTLTELNNKFYNAIRKYGWESFVWEIIYQSKDIDHTHHVMETYFINEHNSYNQGYNSTSGGDGGDFSNLSSTMKAIWDNDPDRKKRLSERTVKRYTIIDPSGIEYDVVNLTKFCFDMNLPKHASSNLVHVAKGRDKQYRGWKCSYYQESSVSESDSKS